MKSLRNIIAITLFAFLPWCILAQEQTDTITAAKKVSYRRIPTVTGSYIVKVDETSKVISPLGEGDPVKFAQTISGVAIGAEGTSAIYVRGSGSGNSVFTLDGIPIYGLTHMLGLTTVIPQDVISEIQFSKDGFGNGMSGYTGSQVNIYTKDGIIENRKIRVSLNTFIPGVTYNTSLKKGKSSLLVSARWSPLGQEFSVAKGLFRKNGLGIDSLRTNIFDAFAKLNYKLTDSYSIYATGFYSQDGYKYRTEKNAIQNLKWSNAIGGLRLVRKEEEYDWELSTYANLFISEQEKQGYFSGVYNYLSAKSTVTDFNLSYFFRWHRTGALRINGGASANYTRFEPGTNKVVSYNKSSSEGRAQFAQKLSAFVRIEQEFLDGKALASGSIRGTLYSHGCIRVSPEFYFSGRYYFSPELFADLSVCRTSQFTHILEGMPLGWSTDLIVPSDKETEPENAFQVSPALYYISKKSSFYLGAYYKSMDKLLYYADATSLFGARRAVWKDFIEVGLGKSYGLEVEYSFETERLFVKGAYTLSKTDRSFSGLNEGVSFPAKYDRRHILNVSTEWLVSRNDCSKWLLTGAFTCQSGHWDTAKTDQYGMPLLESILQKNPVDFLVDYCSGINNYHHPAYIRADVGIRYVFKGKTAAHSLYIGVYNVMNRHNPFSIYYDPDSGKWKRLSLIPILPNFSYRIQF